MKEVAPQARTCRSQWRARGAITEHRVVLAIEHRTAVEHARIPIEDGGGVGDVQVMNATCVLFVVTPISQNSG